LSTNRGSRRWGDPSALQDMTLADLIHRCRQESQQGRHRETGACFELFCRAVDDADSQAWSALHRQYHLMVLSWIRIPELPPDLEEDLVQDAWLSFWCSLRSIRLRERFSHVGEILKYLKGCARTAVIEYRRWEQRQRRLLDVLTSLPIPTSSLEILPEDMDRRERLKSVRAWVHDAVTDPRERLYLHLAFEQGLKPGDIWRRFPDVFPDVQAVYRVQERLLKRARRALTSFPQKAVGKRR